MKTVDELFPPKLWWAGDQRVEKFMYPVAHALDRLGDIPKARRTEIYNRAYEAVFHAIREYADGQEYNLTLRNK